jgi:hypothetical protein
MRGRKLKSESLGIEIRARLSEWKQMPEYSRPSLRALARDLGTSHQLLTFYLKRLDEWQAKEYWRQAREIHACAMAENRVLTPSEQQQARAYDRAGIRATAALMVHEAIERIRQESERGPLSWYDIKAPKIFARAYLEAQKLLQKCLQNCIRIRKRFAVIVKETPRQEGEPYIAWVRRIWDQCSKYDTNCPAVITEEILQKCSQGSAKIQKNNFPVILSDAAKSFRRAQHQLATPLNVGRGKGDTCRRMNPQ